MNRTPVLSKGAILAMSKSQDCGKPIVQVLDVKQIQSPNSQATQPERFRMVISDGDHLTQAMLATQLNNLVKDGTISNRCVVRLNEYICNKVQNRKIVIVLNLEAVHGPLAANVGNPVNVDNVATSDTDTRQPQAPLPPQRPTPQPSSAQRNFIPTAGVYDNQPIIPIKGLNPYQNRWTIKARVTSKSERRTFTNSRGPGSLFNVDLLDATGGEIRCTFFNQACEKFFPVIEEGKVYIFSGGQVKYANKKFSNLKNDYEITLDANSTVVSCDEETDIPDVQYHFVEIRDIATLPKDEVIDVLGVILEIGPLETFKSKNGADLAKRVITLGDSSLAKIQLTLWNEKATSYDANEEGLLAVKTVKVSDFNTKSLTALRSSIFTLNPTTSQAQKLQAWWTKNQLTANFEALSVNDFQPRERREGSSVSATRKYISQIKEDELNDEPAVVNYAVRGVITFIKHDYKDNPPWYPACPTMDPKPCNKKVTLLAGKWHCDKCDNSFESCQQRYILSLKASDHTGSTWLTAFNEVGETLLGFPASDLNNLREAGEEKQFEDVFKRALFKRYNFIVRAQKTNYQDEPRVKHTINRAFTVDYADESSSLIQEINRYLES